MADIERVIASLIRDALDHLEIGTIVGDEPDEKIEWVEMCGMSSVQVTLANGRTWLVDVNEGPLA
jgi:hypothetical protein